MSADDKYPAESGRRRFVKGVVGGAALAGVGATGAVSINTLTTATGAGGGPVEAMVIERVSGPAPHGMPQVPVEVDDDGYIRGIWPEIDTEEVDGVEIEIAREELGGVEYSQEWFQYCGNEAHEGFEPDYDSDNYFKSDGLTSYEWQQDEKEEDERFNVTDFEDYEEWGNDVGSSGVGKPAATTWRSEDTEDDIPVILLRSPLIEEAAEDNEWLQASTDQGFIAWVNVCTHFCCVPGYKLAPDAHRYDAEDRVYCQCHQTVYDPFSISSALYIARPRPED